MTYTTQLPLTTATNSTYAQIETLKNFVKQSVKNLLLTSPGERIMIPEFGVGLKGYLFESPAAEDTAEKIRIRISRQFNLFLPTVFLDDISIVQQDHVMLVRVTYSLSNFNLKDFLEIAVIN